MDISPGDAPWWNGWVASMIKAVKKGVHHRSAKSIIFGDVDDFV